ncbi:hypothetical protein [Microcoleus sp. CAWBG58]|nr:hypothetical protein [Microcoleus sp. CAWBG58]
MADHSTAQEVNAEQEIKDNFSQVWVSFTKQTGTQPPTPTPGYG